MYKSMYHTQLTYLRLCSHSHMLTCLYYIKVTNMFVLVFAYEYSLFNDKLREVQRAQCNHLVLHVLVNLINRSRNTTCNLCTTTKLPRLLIIPNQFN